MNDAIKVGIFMFVILVLVGVFIIKIEEIPVRAKGVKVIQVQFPNVAGLDEKAAVRIAGVRVGKVRSIRLKDQGAEVMLEVSGDIILGKGARAAVRNMGLLGDKYVELIPGDPTQGILEKNTILKGSYPVSYDEILKLVEAIGKDVKALTTTFRQSLGGEEGKSKLDAILSNLQELTQQLKAISVENRPNIQGITTNLRESTTALKEKLPVLISSLQNLTDHLDHLVEENRKPIGNTVKEVNLASQHLKEALAHIETITARIEKGEGTVGKLFKEEDAHDKLVKALDAVSSGADSITQSLGRVNRWRLDLNFRTDYQGEIKENKSFFGFQLTPQPDRFYLLEIVDDPLGKRKEKTEQVTTTLPDGTEVTETQTSISYDKTYLITAMFGWRIRNFQFRAGVLESTGGVALDWFPLRKWAFSLEASDFGRDYGEKIHAKLWSRYFLTPHLYLTAGWDNPFNEDKNTWILGGGFSWSDEDLKYLLGAGLKP